MTVDDRTSPRADLHATVPDVRIQLPYVRPLRIAHVTATYPPYHGGTGNVAKQNAEELVRRGHTVDVLTAQRTGTPHAAAATNPVADFGHGEVRRLTSFGRIGNAPLTPTLAWHLRGYDLVHLHYPYFFGAEFTALGTFLSGCPYVVTYHQDVLFQGPLRRAEQVHHAVMGQHLLARAARVFVTSADYGRASRIGPILARMPGRVDVLPNAVDTQRFHPGVERVRLREQYGLEERDRVVLFTGALDRPHYFKGISVLLDAISQIDDPTIKLLIVGDGDMRSEYEARAQALGLSHRVTFCGRVSDAALPEHYAAADVHVLPSTTMGEAFGVVLLEAMATAKPVIASRLPGVRTVISEGTDGLLCEPGDARELAQAVRSIVYDADRAISMGQAGRAKMETVYDGRAVGARLEGLYLDLLSERSRHQRKSR